AAARQVLELPARAVLAEVEPEARALQAVEQRLVEVLGTLGEELVAVAREGERRGDREQIAILQRGALVVERIGQLCAGLDVDDQRRAALDKRDMSAARVEILGDVMAAVAGADDDGVAALPGLAVLVLA